MLLFSAALVDVVVLVVVLVVNVVLVVVLGVVVVGDVVVVALANFVVDIIHLVVASWSIWMVMMM